MDKNQSLKLASVVFAIVALLHLLRSLFSWNMVVENFTVPLYFSYIVVIVLGYLSWHLFNAAK